MIQHDPLRHIIANIGLVESCNPLDRALLTHCSEKVKELKDLYYHNQHDLVDYNSADYQSAYMIYYFPIYIENIFRTLNNVDRLSLNGSFKNDMKVCIYGGGPAPELYGFLAFLNKHFPEIDHIDTHFFDKNNWEFWRGFCLKNHLGDYWRQSKTMTYYEYFCDLCEFYKQSEINNYSIIKEADLHIIQNCGLDIINSLKDIQKYRQVFHNLVQSMKKGSVIVIIDVPVYNVNIDGTLFDIRGNLHRLRSQTQSDQNFTILGNVSDGAPYQYNTKVVVPPIIRDNFPPIKNTVKYHSLVMKKNN